MQMIPLHTALCVALTQSHLFDDEGTLMPFVFSAELATIAHARFRFPASYLYSPRFPHTRIGDDFRADVLPEGVPPDPAAAAAGAGRGGAAAAAAASPAGEAGSCEDCWSGGAYPAEEGEGAKPVIGSLERMSAGNGGVPDEVVREAWMRTAPWMHVSIPDWWAFKVRRCSCTPPMHM